MNKLRGYTEVVIGGKKRPVKFGTNQTILFNQHRGITLKEYAGIFKKDRLKNMEFDGSEIRDLAWSGLKGGALYENQEFDFTPEDVGNWIDDAKQGIVAEIFTAMMSRLKADVEDDADDVDEVKKKK